MWCVCLTVRQPYHVLHTDADLSITVEGPVKSHNIGRITLMQHLQLSDDLVPDGWLDLQVDQLSDHSESQWISINNYLLF